MLRSFMNREEGQGLVEYALILVLIAVVVIVVMRALGVQITAVFQRVSNSMNVPAGQ